MKSMKWFVGVALVLFAVSILIRSFAQAHRDPDQDEGEEETIKVPSRVSVVNGQTVITLDRSTERRAGIVAVKLRTVVAERNITAAGVVLTVQDLISLDSAYIAASAAVKKAEASLGVSEKEYQRLAELYRENQNASKKSLEAAEGAFNADQAALGAARQQLQGAEAAVRSSWGPRVAAWTADDGPELRALLAQQELPVQVTLPTGSAFTDPPAVAISAPDGATYDANYVSPFPRVDPRIQGISLLYLTSARPGLAPRTTLVVHFSAGHQRRGVFVPGSAIIWWQGEAWAYEQTSPTQFIRRLVPTGEPSDQGYIVTQGFRAGDNVVVRGVQELLSEEFRSQIQPED
ncbi:MAG TPA: hypothetical protein VJV74_07665 [Terriglobia bacterium]|nr:hypothetical protein [Terriglobia bacterium]